MFNRTKYAKAFIAAAHVLAIVLLTIGMGVNPSWAGSDRPTMINFSPIPSDVVSQPVPAVRHQPRSPVRIAACAEKYTPCFKDEMCCTGLYCLGGPQNARCCPPGSKGHTGPCSRD